MAKIYYDNLLANQNFTAKSNLVWTADITEIILENEIKIYVFLCIDIHTNTTITYCLSIRIVKSSAIVKKLSKEMDKRFWVEPENKLIIDTDRGTQFSSKTYNNFIKKYNAFMLLSMSRENTPTDNAVVERFMRTFKDHLIDGVKLQEALFNCEFKSCKTIRRKYVENLNRTPNNQTAQKGSGIANNRVTVASMLMRDTKAFSKYLEGDPRSDQIIKYKQQNNAVGSILDEIAARKAEIVNETPFDNFDDNLMIKVIGEPIKALYDLIQQNPEVIREYVEKAVEPINDSLEELHFKIDQLLPKDRKQREIQPLRDPIDFNLYTDNRRFKIKF